MGETAFGDINWKEYWKHRKNNLLYCFMQIDYNRFRELYRDRAFTIDSLLGLLFKTPESRLLAKNMIDKIVELRLKTKDANEEYTLDFTQLCGLLGTPKSSTWNVYKALLRAGILDRTTKRAPIRLSAKFSSMLRDLSYWYDLFLERSGFTVRNDKQDFD
ncbi:MAG: hypothetical protein PHW96_01650 [Candidatus Nanoarchaeia archaeon]|nr:hypothetical protein [Candidatus Nanoarchaeia archaeon]